MYESRRYEQDQRFRRPDESYERQWRDVDDGRFGGTERRGDERGFDRSSERSFSGGSGSSGDTWNRGAEAGYPAGGRQWQTGYMSRNVDTDRWMDAPRPSGQWDSNRSWFGSGGGVSDRQQDSWQSGGYQGGGRGWNSSFGESRENYSGRGPKGFHRSDDRIREQVSERLTDDRSVDASDIEIDVKNGEVTLRGTVRDRQQKRRAEEVAESCSGVSDVTNSIRVSKQEQSGYQEDSQSSSQGRGSQRMSQAGSQKTNGKGSHGEPA